MSCTTSSSGSTATRLSDSRCSWPNVRTRSRLRPLVVANRSPNRTRLMRLNGTVVSPGRTGLAVQAECRRCRTSVSRVRENRMHGSRWRRKETQAYTHRTGQGTSRPTRPVVGPLVAGGASDLHQSQKLGGAGFTRVRRVPPVALPVDDALSFPTRSAMPVIAPRALLDIFCSLGGQGSLPRPAGANGLGPRRPDSEEPFV